ncbi:c-type cytochrome [Rhodovulum sp. DZ06]|uniref:c-type cytochrome n=1 Tax=Rhodovulum sp. DZ06 TaxID=3425126 RepID=UPI003D354BC6
MRARAPMAALVLALAAGAGAAAGAPADPASPAGMAGPVKADRLPPTPHPALETGRAVWAGRCFACHGISGDAGAPKITRRKAWDTRIAQGLPVLFDHALNGFMGPRYTEMPPRGGDPDLTDDQVKAAVAFMVWMSGGRAPVAAWLDQMETSR